MPRLNLKMPFGEVSFDFTDNKDLEEHLDKVDFDALAKTVVDKVPSLVLPQRQGRDETKDLVDSHGKFMMFKKSPKAKIDMVILAIYAYGTGATIDEIRRTTGIPDPSGDAINSGSSRRYFTTLDKANQVYGLSPEGLQRVVNEIIPLLRQNNERAESKDTG